MESGDGVWVDVRERRGEDGVGREKRVRISSQKVARETTIIVSPEWYHSGTHQSSLRPSSFPLLRS
jgi:hypothetical protein